MTDSGWYWLIFWVVFCTVVYLLFSEYYGRASTICFLLAVCSLIAPAAKVLGLRAGPLIAHIIIGHAGAIVLVLANTSYLLRVGDEMLAFAVMGTIASLVIGAAGWGWCVRTKEDALGFGVWAKHALYYLLATSLLAFLLIFLFESHWPWTRTMDPSLAECFLAYGLARTIPMLALCAIAKWQHARANPKSKI